MYRGPTVVGSRVRSHERRTHFKAKLRFNDNDEERTFGLYVGGIAVCTAAILGLHGCCRRGPYRSRVRDAGASSRSPNSRRAQENGHRRKTVAIDGPVTE